MNSKLIASVVLTLGLWGCGPSRPNECKPVGKFRQAYETVTKLGGTNNHVIMSKVLTDKGEYFVEGAVSAVWGTEVTRCQGVFGDGLQIGDRAYAIVE